MADWADSLKGIWNRSFDEPGKDFTLPELRNFKAEFFKALAHPLRISILDALRGGEKTVAEISQQFEIESAYASQQLAVLRNRNIIVARKSGANVYYSVSDPIIFKLLDVAKEIFNNHLVGVRSMLEEIKAEGRRRKS
jgi:DNA-binding transcriptional ArsR family regulator